MTGKESFFPETWRVRMLWLWMIMMLAGFSFICGHVIGYRNGVEFARHPRMLSCDDWSNPSTCKWVDSEPLPKQYQP